LSPVDTPNGEDVTDTKKNGTAVMAMSYVATVACLILAAASFL
jgi:hypothetical protein